MASGPLSRLRRSAHFSNSVRASIGRSESRSTACNSSAMPCSVGSGKIDVCTAPGEASLPRVRNQECRQRLDGVVEALPADFDQRDVDSIDRSAAHESGNEHETGTVSRLPRRPMLTANWRLVPRCSVHGCPAISGSRGGWWAWRRLRGETGCRSPAALRTDAYVSVELMRFMPRMGGGNLHVVLPAARGPGSGKQETFPVSPGFPHLLAISRTRSADGDPGS